MVNGDKLQRGIPLLLLILVVFVLVLNLTVIWNSYSLSRTRSAMESLTANHLPHVFDAIKELDKKTSNLETSVTNIQVKINDFEGSLNNYLNDMRKENIVFQQQIRQDVRDEIQKRFPPKE